MLPTPTATPVDYWINGYPSDWIGLLMDHRGYKHEWGEPQYGGIYKTADPRPASMFQTTLGYGAFSRWQFAAHNSLMMMDPWGEITDAPICDLCESFEVSADGLTYTFVLRDNVQFHEEGWAKEQGAPGFGTELVCEDIRASHEWFANPPPDTHASVIGRGRQVLGHLDEVSCPDGPLGKTAVMQFRPGSERDAGLACGRHCGVGQGVQGVDGRGVSRYPVYDAARGLPVQHGHGSVHPSVR